MSLFNYLKYVYLCAALFLFYFFDILFYLIVFTVEYEFL